MISSKEAHEFAYTVKIDKGLTPKDPPLSYSVVVEFEKGILTKREQGKPKEKHAVKVTYPVKQLTIVVAFPNDWSIKEAYRNVDDNYGRDISSERIRAKLKDISENKIGTGFEDIPEEVQNGKRYKLTIKNPVVHLRYLIDWELPA